MVLRSNATMNNLKGFAQPEIAQVDFNAVLDSMKHESSSYLTLCEQLRFIYDVVAEIKDPEIVKDLESKLVVAFWMAKKMNSRLAYYKKTYNKDFSGSKGSNLLKLGFVGERKRIRIQKHI